MVYVCYNSKLEQSFLIDLNALFNTSFVQNETEEKTIDSILRKQIESIKDKYLNNDEKRNFVDYLFDDIDENKEEKFNKEIKRKQFEYLLDKLILSSSQFVKYSIPYLLSEKGYKECSLKSYLPIDYINYYYDSNILSALNLNERGRLKVRSKCFKNESNFDWTTSNCEKKVKEPHDFLKIHLIKSINDEEIKVDY
jgi:hypothetical protein